MSAPKNTTLAIVLSALVLMGWQIYFGLPQMEKQKQIQQQQAQERSQQPPPVPQQGGTTPAAPGTAPQASTQPGTVAQPMSREAALALSPRVRIETPSLSGSISLKGGRIDDLSLVRYRETVDPSSPPIVLLAPSGSPHPFYAEFGWSPPSGAPLKLPNADTMWQQEGAGTLGVGRPVTLVYDNGEGLSFRRTIAVDENYLFTLKDEVTNKRAAPVTLYPFGLISRHGTPQTLGYYILHEGLIGVFGDKGLQEETYTDIEKKKEGFFSATDVWLGITDKYWATTLLPDTNAQVAAKLSTGTIADDKMKQQQAMMELYKKEKINPIAGCLPIVIQIPVFFALYKVLFVTIEMRHAPFFGWIKDLAAPDPTTIFNLFGLIPWDPSHVPLLGPFLLLGIWPLIMGVTMWFQMKLNPPPPDPTQAMIFNYMPIIFTFMLASFPAGLVIYWAWNNTLSVAQQSVIMHRHGAKIELFDNLKRTWEALKNLFTKKKSDAGVSGSSS